MVVIMEIQERLSIIHSSSSNDNVKEEYEEFECSSKSDIISGSFFY